MINCCGGIGVAVGVGVDVAVGDGVRVAVGDAGGGVDVGTGGTTSAQDTSSRARTEIPITCLAPIGPHHSMVLRFAQSSGPVSTHAGGRTAPAASMLWCIAQDRLRHSPDAQTWTALPKSSILGPGLADGGHMSRDFAGRGKVAILRTTPETVLEDYARLMELAGFQEVLPRDKETILKINISWQTWYPACSTAPWQLEGVIRSAAGRRLREPDRRPQRHRGRGCLRRRAQQQAQVRHRQVRRAQRPPVRAGSTSGCATSPSSPSWCWTRSIPTASTSPRSLIGNNIIQLPTVKTHVFTTITGAMKNAFGGLLGTRRHWTHGVIHETLVDLLHDPAGHPPRPLRRDGRHLRRRRPRPARDALAREGRPAGLGGPGGHRRASRPSCRASTRCRFPSSAWPTSMGLGVGDPDEIEIVGDDRIGSWPRTGASSRRTPSPAAGRR